MEHTYEKKYLLFYDYYFYYQFYTKINSNSNEIIEDQASYYCCCCCCYYFLKNMKFLNIKLRKFCKYLTVNQNQGKGKILGEIPTFEGRVIEKKSKKEVIMNRVC